MSYQHTPKNANVTHYIKKKRLLCNTLNQGNWNSGFVKLVVWWAERDTCNWNLNRSLFPTKQHHAIYALKLLTYSIVIVMSHDQILRFRLSAMVVVDVVYHVRDIKFTNSFSPIHEYFLTKFGVMIVEYTLMMLWIAFW